jgi:hypothetical protein
MKLGLDIHGVLDVQPKFFSKLTKDLVAAGWEIHIITGGSAIESNVLQELEDCSIAYTHFFSVYDHLIEVGAKTNEELGIASRYPFPDETWNKVKSIYCEKHGIDMHIDDMPEYLEHFTTPYMTHIDKNRNHRGQFGRHDDAA